MSIDSEIVRRVAALAKDFESIRKTVLNSESDLDQQTLTHAMDATDHLSFVVDDLIGLSDGRPQPIYRGTDRWAECYRVHLSPDCKEQGRIADRTMSLEQMKELRKLLDMPELKPWLDQAIRYHESN